LSIQTTTRLRTWRERIGYSLQEVADLGGVDTAMLSRAERGLKSFSPATKVRLARRLGVRVADLFEVEELEPAGSG
jgi:transcriptional regulator with XRE-family HTH domain